MANYGERYDKKISVRLNNTQFEYLCHNSDLLGVSPSDVLRMILDNSICKGETENNEYKSTDIDNFV